MKMERSSVNKLFSTLPLACLCLACFFSVGYIRQASAQQYRPETIRQPHEDNSDNRIEATYAIGANPLSLRPHNTQNPKSGKHAQHDHGSHGNSETGDISTQNLYLHNSAGIPIKPELDEWIVRSSLLKSITKSSPKRFLDSIASDIIKKDLNKILRPPVTSDKLRNVDSSSEKVASFPQFLHQQDFASLPEIYFKEQDSFYPNDIPETYADQAYDNIYDEDDLYQNRNDMFWDQNDYHFTEPETADHLTRPKFNDSFQQHFKEGKVRDFKRFLDPIAGEIIKRSDTNDKRYLDSLAYSLIKKNPYLLVPSTDFSRTAFSRTNSLKDAHENRYLDSVYPSINKKRSNNAADAKDNVAAKRYLDSVGSSLIKKQFDEQTKDDSYSEISGSSPDWQKHKVSHPGKSLDDVREGSRTNKVPDTFDDILEEDLFHISKGAGNRPKTGHNFINVNNHRELYQNWKDSSRIIKEGTDKRYLDGIASSLIKKDDGEKRYLDGITSSLIKKDGGEKRYLDGIASSLIKKDDREKRYLDGIASSLIKKDDGVKRYLDGIASSLIKKDDREKRYLDGIASSVIKKNVGEKRYLDGIASSLIKKDVEKRYLDGIASSLIKKDDGEKRYLDGIASSLIKKDVDKRYLDGIASSLIKKDGGEKHYLDGIASSLIKKDDGEKRYLDGIASSLIKKDDGEKRYLDGIASSLIKKDDGEKRYLDGIASFLIKKDQGEKRYLDGIASSLIKKDDGEKRYLDGIASSLIKKDDGEKRYLDGIASSLIKKDDGEKRYLDGIASSLIKKGDGETRYLDGIASSLIKKDDKEKRYLDGIASSLIKKNDGEKRYLDGIASSLIKKDDGEKRYLDGIASSLIKKNDGEKRYLDGIASSLIKKDDGEKRYLDGIASSLIKKNDGEKRYLDGIASSLIKKDDGEKRYLDGIASSLIKKDDGEKRFLDGIASSLIKKDDGEKRYLDGIASSLIKKDDGEKRYLDGIASSLIKKDDGEKRYLDGIASSLIKKDDGEKRYLDGIASSLIKKDDGEKRYLDGIASSLIKKDDGEKRYLDGIASSLIKKDDGEKRYLDGIASSLIKKDDGEKRYLDGIASSLIKKKFEDQHYFEGIANSLMQKESGEEKRYLDGIASSLIKKANDAHGDRYFDGVGSSMSKEDFVSEKRYLDSIASSLIKKDNSEKRYLDGVASSLIKRDSRNKPHLDMVGSSLSESDVKTFPDVSPGHKTGESAARTTTKRMFEVTDDVMDGSRDAKVAKKASVINTSSTTSMKSDRLPTLKGPHSRRRRRDASKLSVEHERSKVATLHHPFHRQRRFIDGIASTVLYKRFGLNPRSMSKLYRGQSDQKLGVQMRNRNKYNMKGRRIRSKQKSETSVVLPGQDNFSRANSLPVQSYYMPMSNVHQHQTDLENEQLVGVQELTDSPARFRFPSTETDVRDLEPKPVTPGKFWTFRKVDPAYKMSSRPSFLDPWQTQSYVFGQVLLPQQYESMHNFEQLNNNFNKLTANTEQSKDKFSQNTKRMLPYHREANTKFKEIRKVSLAKLSKDPYIDEIAASMFKSHTVFKKTYLNDQIAAIFHKRYLNFLNSSPETKRQKGARVIYRQPQKTVLESGTSRNISKKFDINTLNKTAGKYVPKTVTPSFRRFPDASSGSCEYKLPLEVNATIHKQRESLQKSRSKEGQLASTSSRLRRFPSQAEYKEKQNTASLKTWDGQRTLMKLVKAANPVPETAYQTPSLLEYVRHITKDILGRTDFTDHTLDQTNNLVNTNQYGTELVSEETPIWNQQRSYPQNSFVETGRDLLI